MAKQRYVGYAVRVCFGDVDPKVPWDKLGYIAWHERAERYMKAGIKQAKCGECGRWRWPDDKTHGHSPEPTQRRNR